MKGFGWAVIMSFLIHVYCNYTFCLCCKISLCLYLSRRLKATLCYCFYWYLQFTLKCAIPLVFIAPKKARRGDRQKPKAKQIISRTLYTELPKTLHVFHTLSFSCKPLLKGWCTERYHSLFFCYPMFTKRNLS